LGSIFSLETKQFKQNIAAV